MSRLTLKNEDWCWKDEEFWLSAEEPTLEKADNIYYKLAELEDLMEKYHCNDIVDLENMIVGNRLTIEDNGETILCGDGYCINYDVARIVKENTELKKKLVNCVDFKIWQKTAKKNQVLEKQLVESEERVKDLEFRNKNLEHSLKVAPNANAGQRARIVELKEINHKLKQQLAEKEKEIENIKLCRCVNCTNEYEFMLEGLVEDLEKQIDKDNQDKISFAVEQLEKVKENIKKVPITDYDLNGCFEKMYKSDAVRQVDNQIKQLKEGK